VKQEILSKLLSKALRLWLRSQVSHVSNLELTIHGTNQQLLSGEIPQVDLAAHQAVYQDLHLSEVSLRGSNIKINLKQILQGKPIQLLEPIPLTGALTLTAADLQTSLAAPLLATALKDLLQTLLGSRHDLQIPPQIHWQQAEITAGFLKLVGSYAVAQSKESSGDQSVTMSSPIMNQDAAPEISKVILQTGLTLAQPHQLCLTPLAIDFADPIGVINLESFSLDLGEDVAIQELLVTEGKLTCHGKLTVQP
jgi:hypothetical protein